MQSFINTLITSKPTTLISSYLDTAKDLEALQAQRIVDQLNKATLAQKPKEFEMQNALRQAQIQNYLSEIAGRPTEQKLKEAQIQNYLSEISNRSQNSLVSPMGKAMQDYQRIVSLHGENSNEAKEMQGYLNKLKMGSQGLQISSTPGGGFTITQGGLQPIDTVGGQQQDGLIKSPISSSSTRSNAGAVLYDPKTGEETMVPTGKFVDTGQAALAAAPIVSSNLKLSFKKLSPFLGMNKRPELWSQQAKQFFGNETPALDKYQSVLRGMLPMTADQMIAEMKLRPTNAQVEMVSNAIIPRRDDTKYSYGRRISSALAQIAVRDENTKALLLQGFSRKSGEDISAYQERLEEMYYKELLGSLEENNVEKSFSYEDLLAEKKRRLESKKRGGN